MIPKIRGGLDGPHSPGPPDHRGHRLFLEMPQPFYPSPSIIIRNKGNSWVEN
jgi:hypothetical protein